MAFLRKKENTLINLINAAGNLSDDQKRKMVSSVKYNAKLRQDPYRKRVKVFLNVITDFKNQTLVNRLLHE